jgi:hypothetical protein
LLVGRKSFITLGPELAEGLGDGHRLNAAPQHLVELGAARRQPENVPPVGGSLQRRKIRVKSGVVPREAQYQTGENLKVFLAGCSTLSYNVLLYRHCRYVPFIPVTYKVKNSGQMCPVS